MPKQLQPESAGYSGQIQPLQREIGAMWNLHLTNENPASLSFLLPFSIADSGEGNITAAHLINGTQNVIPTLFFDI
jgi:hypothetical protein